MKNNGLRECGSSGMLNEISAGTDSKYGGVCDSIIQSKE